MNEPRDHLSLANDLIQQSPEEACAHALVYIAEMLQIVVLEVLR